MLAAREIDDPSTDPDYKLAPLLLTCQQAADMLTISTRTLWQMTHDGDLPSIRIRNSVRYDRRDISAYVERLRNEALRELASRDGFDTMRADCPVEETQTQAE